MYLPNERQSVWLDALRILYFGIPRKILVPMNVLFAVWEAISLYIGKISYLMSSWILVSSSTISLLIYLYRYCAIYLLLYCMLEAWGYYFLYFLFLTSASIFLQMSKLRRQIYSTQLQAKNSLWSLIHSLSANRLMMQKPSLFLRPLQLVAHYDVK